MKIALIPARGGSKRIPRKNIRQFCGKPMLAWPVEAALQSGLFDEVVVSTDDAEIAEVARSVGASVPFLRPANLSDDHTPARAVINHAILDAESRWGCKLAEVCCLYATAAFVTPDHLNAAKQLLDESTECDFVFAAAGFAHPVQRAMTVMGECGVEMLFPEHAGTRSQDLPETFHDAGQFYFGRRQAFVDEQPMFGPRSKPLILHRNDVQDIDTPEDWSVAETLFRMARGS